MGSVVAWELLYLWNSVPMIAQGTLEAMVEVRQARKCSKLVYQFDWYIFDSFI